MGHGRTYLQYQKGGPFSKHKTGTIFIEGPR